jgi:pilus assembly protein CpaE
VSNYLLASADAGLERSLRLAYGGGLDGRLVRLEDADTFLNPAQALQQLTSRGGVAPDVLILGQDLDLESALKISQRFDDEHPEISIVLVAQPSPKLWERALRAGVRDVLSVTAPDAEIREILDRVGATAARRRANLAPDDAPARDARVITVVSPKGGSGKTTIATNLAVGLASASPGQTAMVDLDLQFGDVSSGLQLMPDFSIANAVSSNGHLDATGLKAFLTTHDSGLYALCAPPTPAEGEQITTAQVSKVLGLLEQEFKYLVIDTSAGLTEHTLAALEVSTDVVFVCSMDVPSVRGLRKVVEALDQLGMHAGQRHFVLNRADARVGLDTQDVAATIGLPIDTAIQSSRSVPLSTNQGTPIIQAQPRSPVARELAGLVDRFLDHPASAPRDTSTPGGLFRRRGTR